MLAPALKRRYTTMKYENNYSHTSRDIMTYNLKPILKRKSLTTQNSMKEKKSVAWFDSIPEEE